MMLSEVMLTLLDSIHLLRAFYADFMIDHTLLLTWIPQTLNSSNLAQAGFLIRLLEDYYPEMGSCRALLRLAINACLGKMQEVNDTVDSNRPKSYAHLYIHSDIQ